MAIRYKAVNASAEAPDTFAVLSSNRTEINLQEYETLFYTVPVGCTAKVNYLRMVQGSVYGYYISNASTGYENARSYTPGAYLTLKTKNGNTFKDLYSLEDSNNLRQSEIDVSDKYLYLNEGDKLFLCHVGLNLTTGNNTYTVFSRLSIMKKPGILASIIEEYQS